VAMQYSTRSITIESTILVTRANILDIHSDIPLEFGVSVKVRGKYSYHGPETTMICRHRRAVGKFICQFGGYHTSKIV